MDGKTLAAFATAVVLGGVNFVGVRVSNEELDPIWGAALSPLGDRIAVTGIKGTTASPTTSAPDDSVLMFIYP